MSTVLSRDEYETKNPNYLRAAILGKPRDCSNDPEEFLCEDAELEALRAENEQLKRDIEFYRYMATKVNENNPGKNWITTDTVVKRVDRMKANYDCIT